MVTITDKGNYVEINRGEPSRRYVVKPFDVDICGTDKISIGDGLKNNWEFAVADLTGWTYTDIYDLKDQLIALNNNYQVDAVVTIDTDGLATEPKQDDIIAELEAINQNTQQSISNQNDKTERILLNEILKQLTITNKLLKSILS